MTIEIKVRHTRYSSSRATGVGPNAWPMSTLLLRYHIAVCRVLGLNSR